MVRGKKKDDAVKLADEEANGQKRIPGTEIPIVKDLVSFAQRRTDLLRQHGLLTTALTDANDEAVTLFKKHKQYFEDDGKGGYIYEAAGAVVRVGHPDKWTVKTSIEQPED